MLSLSIGAQARRPANWWQQSSFAALDAADGKVRFSALSAQFGRGRYALTSLSAATIPAAVPEALAFMADAAFSDLFSFSRATNATCLDGNRVLVTAGPDIARFDHTHGSRMLLLEGAATNCVRNNSNQGTVAGSPGTLPNNTFGTSPAGITRTIGTPTVENGVDVLDYRFNGTATGAVDIQLESPSQTAAVAGQTWAASIFCKLASGSFANVLSVQLIISEWDTSGTVFKAATATSIGGISTTLSRVSTNRTLSDVATGRITMAFRINVAGAVDFTLRIGMPQLELGSQPSSVIRTTSAATTRAADSCQLSAKALALLSRASVGSVIKGRGLSGAAGRVIGGASGRVVGLNIGQTGIVVGNTTSVSASTTLSSPTPAIGVAAGWSAAGKAISCNGSAIATDSTAMDATLSAAYLGRDGTGNAANGWYDELTIYPFRPANAALVAKAVANG